LFADDYVELTHDTARGLVRYRRTSRPFPSIDVMRAVHGKLSGTLPGATQRPLALLIDVRDAPPRNDAGFESEVTRSMSDFFAAFRARAFLVKSAVGKLQVRRIAASQGGSPGSVFSNESEALEFLGV
jgi:hypothetical protein